MRILVSNSQITSKDLCDKQHDYLYLQEIEPRQFSLSIRRGKAGHRLLETYYKCLLTGQSHEDALGYTGLEYYAIVSESDPEDYEQTKMLTDLWKLLGWYFNYYGERDTFKVLHVEETFSTELYYSSSYQIDFGMIVDLIVEYTTGPNRGAVDILDHKFTYNFKSPDDLRLDGQQPKYWKVAKANGFPIRDAVFNQIRYRTMKSQNPTDYFRRSPLLSSKNTIDSVWSDAQDTALDIIKQDMGEVELIKRRRLSYTTCRNCFFKKLCMTEQAGEPSDLIRKIEYKKRDRPLKNWMLTHVD